MGSPLGVVSGSAAWLLLCSRSLMSDTTCHSDNKDSAVSTQLLDQGPNCVTQHAGCCMETPVQPGLAKLGCIRCKEEGSDMSMYINKPSVDRHNAR